MAVAEIKLLAERLQALEAEVALLKEKERIKAQEELPWWEKTWGIFADDPDYDTAMALGRKYRESLRPKPARKKTQKKKAGKSSKSRKR